MNRWIERWHGSCPDRGWSIWEMTTGTHGDRVAYVGEDEHSERLTALIVQKHNDSLAAPEAPAQVSQPTSNDLADAAGILNAHGHAALADRLLTASEATQPTQGERNQCDGCAAGAPVSASGVHRYSDGSRMACTKDRYTQPTQGEAPSGVTREDIEGARALMDMSEAEIDDELRRLGIDPDVAATKLGGFLCRLCGKDRPHAHSPEDVVIFRNGVKSATKPTQGEAPSEREAMEEAWHECRAACDPSGWTVSESAAYRGFFAHGFRAALASQPQAEAVPVAQVEIVVPHLRSIVVKHILGAPMPKVGDHLYTTPPTQASQPQAVDAGYAAWLADRVAPEIDLIVSDPDTALSDGAKRSLAWIRAAIDAARRAGGAE